MVNRCFVNHPRSSSAGTTPLEACPATNSTRPLASPMMIPAGSSEEDGADDDGVDDAAEEAGPTRRHPAEHRASCSPSTTSARWASNPRSTRSGEASGVPRHRWVRRSSMPPTPSNRSRWNARRPASSPPPADWTSRSLRPSLASHTHGRQRPPLRLSHSLPRSAPVSCSPSRDLGVPSADAPLFRA